MKPYCRYWELRSRRPGCKIEILPISLHCFFFPWPDCVQFFFYSFQLASTFLALTLKSLKSARFAWPLGRHLWPRAFGQSAFTVLTINLNPSLNFPIFVAHGRHTRPEKLEFLSARIPVFRSVSDNIVPFTCLFTFAIVSGLRWLAKFWRLGKQWASGSIGGGIQIPETSLQALSSFPLPPPPPHPQESLLAG